ncbi:hypothetical protein AI29_05335 [bacteria symbiont BFo2 of Frankliniella occidentalis]|nr:hypothetical protein AI29_05335 [bacteria symbiont BFo2 of Frankliniella occidentalis]KYP90495.1 hypothetical protein WB60_07665 [bacteria symbiont BFo2 of Frankliniella occidentalis]KYP95255.1 hypothetical protein WB67_06845 [bacteria symbiont BFo2 of Frankliniella occidentalis]
MNRLWLFGILLFLSVFETAAGKAQGRVECFVFIDTAIPEQLALFKQFNREYYSSLTLQQLGSMTFINIGLQPLANTTTVPPSTIRRGSGYANLNRKIYLRCFRCSKASLFNRRSRILER